MKKEVPIAVNAGKTSARVTRAQAAALRGCGGMLPPKAPVQQSQRNLRSNVKRAKVDENNSTMDAECHQRKRRAVLKDVTNISCQNSYMNCINAAKTQVETGKQFKKGLVKVSKVGASVIAAPQLQTDEETKVVCVKGKTRDLEVVVVSSPGVESNAQFLLNNANDRRDNTGANIQLEKQECATPLHLQSLKKADVGGPGWKLIQLSNPDVIDIDFDSNDPQLCSLYASDIYSNLRVAELIRRPCPKFMERMQTDITQGMRGILVDWLVEVSEEYKLVPDTLYLTVYFIDLFLSQNHIERQRLQLLGITCMLVASKYEEICAPRVEEFCFITDNTYTRGEVLNMESQVLNYFAFQLSVPTTKTFLRRFLRAAQATYKCQSLELEYLANYLAELTLVDYSFLNFLPSVIAASAVFLARWTLDQSGHPWNPTLEHYTTYMASDLESASFALQDLQLNNKGCPLNAIRAKYRQEKFKAVANLTSPTLPQTLFQRQKC